MKRYLSTTIATLAILATACDEASMIQGEDIPLEPTASLKVRMPEVDGLDCLWSFEDRVMLSVDGGEWKSQLVYPYSDYVSASLGSAFHFLTPGSSLGLVYPASAVKGAMIVELPQVQKSANGFPQKSSMLMAGKAQVGDAESLEFSLVPLFSYASLKVEGLAEGEMLNGIKLSASAPLAGEARLSSDFSSITPSAEASNSIDVLPAEDGSASMLTFFPLSSEATASLSCEIMTASGDTYTGGVITSKPVLKAGESAEFTACVVLQPKPAPAADLLDLGFNADGGAVERSAGKTVKYVYSNLVAAGKVAALADRVAVQFNHDFNEQPLNSSGTLGTSGSYGYYRYDYSSDATFKEAYAKEHSISCVFCMDNVPTNDVVIAGSLNGGGSAIMIHNGHICSAEYAPELKYCDSRMEPEPGKYYHVVSSCSSLTGKMTLFVDGEIAASESVGGYTDSSLQAFTVGAAPKNAIEGKDGMRGSVVDVKIFSKAISLSEVKGLYQEVLPASAKVEDFFTIADLRMPQAQVVMKDDSFAVAGKVIQETDVVIFEPLAGGSPVEAVRTAYEVTTYGGASVLKVAVPAGLTDGMYKVSIKRGSHTHLLGTVKFAFGLSLYDQTKIKGVSQNSYGSTGEQVGKTIDGNQDTGWQSNYGTHTETNILHEPHDGKTYDLVYEIEKSNVAAVVITDNPDPRGRADIKELEIFVSDDGVNWTSVHKAVKHHGVHIYHLKADVRTAMILDTPVQARFIKVSIDDAWRFNRTYCCANIRELNVYTK